MTTPNPTPAEREREAADELSWKLYETLSAKGAVIGNASVSIMSPLIAAALARERREAMEIACRAVCGWCSGKHSADYLPAEYLPIPGTYSFGWVHQYKNGGSHLTEPCDAANIRARMEKEK